MTKVQKTVVVDLPVREVYDQWTQFEQFPAFMSGVKKVEQLDDVRTHWVAEISGVKRERDAVILEQVPDEKIRGRRPRASRTRAPSTSSLSASARRRCGWSWSTSPRAWSRRPGTP